MRKALILSVLSLILLTGCTSANSEILLSDNTSLTAENVEQQEEPSEPIQPQEPVKEEEVIQTIVVYVCGAVVSPGVYELPDGSRVDDAVAAAGGFAENADKVFVNLAARISDGVKLQIPTTDQTRDIKGTVSIESYDTGTALTGDSGSDSSGLININTASKEELASLPGIGDGIAGKIIKYREENGAFKTIEDIMKVSGIKDKLFSKIKDSITV